MSVYKYTRLGVLGCKLFRSDMPNTSSFALMNARECARVATNYYEMASKSSWKLAEIGLWRWVNTVL